MAARQPLLAAALAAALATPARAQVVKSLLDPTTYSEPTDAQHWGTDAADEAPFREERLQSNQLNQQEFDRRVVDGKVFVVEDVGRDWPMKDWDCAFFRNDPTFSKAEMNQQYAEGGGGDFVTFKEDWQKTKSPSGATDEEAPKVAPFYWGIKDVQYPDGHISKTWKKSMLSKVRENARLPPFMDPVNHGNFNRTPEFWFAGPGAGAKAHMDSHIQATMSLQLAGTKRWRLGFMEPRLTAFIGMIFKDGDVYSRPYPWGPHFTVELRPGEALFFPPGFIHETLNLDEGEDSCSASVTFQFDTPFAARLYRKFFPRVRRTPDIHEAWPLIQEWASLHTKTDKRGMGFRKAKADATSAKGLGKRFKSLDKDSDGYLVESELKEDFGLLEARNVINFHDLDEDGKVSQEEFTETFAFWAAVTQTVYNETPKKFRKYQRQDLEGEFNLEDLPKKQTDAITIAAFELEAKIAEKASRAEL